MSEKVLLSVRDFFVGFYRLVVGGSLAFIACTIILWSDRHNDERYVRQTDLKSEVLEIGTELWIKKDAYLDNKGVVEKRLESIESSAKKLAESNEQKLDGIQRDIKDILWRVGGGANPPERR